MKYKVVEQFISPETAKFVYEYLLFSTKVWIMQGNQIALEGDQMVPGCLGPRGGDIVLDTLMKMCKQRVETITGKKLLPTYSYARLYKQGNKLERHKDRPACEYSVTIKLSDNRKGNWPFFVEDQELVLNDGDAVIYKGCEVEHWRDKCNISEYISGQVFLHYVDANGPYVNEQYDKHIDRKDIFEKDINEFL